MAELANCSLCNKLFVRSTSDICPSCHKEIEKKFETVWHFIRQKENREATVMEVHESTGVEEKLIFRWIKTGRLQVKDFKNLHYPCQSCGEPIQTGTLCPSCSARILKDVEALEEQEEKQEKAKIKTYYTR